MLICTVLATPVEKRKPESPSLSPERITALEKLIDNYENELPKLKNFILPGGSPGAAALHFAGTVCRRAERRMVKLSEEAEISKEALSYINRLSDLLFVAGRLANHRAGAEEILWRVT